VSDPVVDEEGRPGRWILVDEPDPVRLARVPRTPELGGFRMAHVFDDPTPDGQPWIDPARGRVTDVEERRRLLRYLESGRQIFDGGASTTDLLEPRRLGAVPTVFRTDGRWIWSDAVTYYLRWHLVPPEPDFWQHIQARGYQPATVGDEVAAAAEQARLAMAQARAAALEESLVGTGALADPARFPIAFQERLRALGWAADRDVTPQVREWLDEQLPAVGFARFDLPEPAGYEPFEAALRVLREFGGLASTDNSAGVTSARIPFRLAPGRTRDSRDLRLMLADAIEYGSLIGERVFQVGVIEDGTAILVVAEDGSVHLAGSVRRWIGHNFDEALVGLMDGELAEEDEADAGFDWDPSEAQHWE
jgi:SUKH-3 immunity protein